MDYYYYYYIIGFELEHSKYRTKEQLVLMNLDG